MLWQTPTTGTISNASRTTPEGREPLKIWGPTPPTMHITKTPYPAVSTIRPFDAPREHSRRNLFGRRREPVPLRQQKQTGQGERHAQPEKNGVPNIMTCTKDFAGPAGQGDADDLP